METTRRNVFAGLASAIAAPLLPAAAVPAKPEPDVITQAELEGVKQLQLKLDLALHSLEWRLWCGATCEPGPHNAKVDCPGDDARRPEAFEICGGVGIGYMTVRWDGKRKRRE